MVNIIHTAPISKWQLPKLTVVVFLLLFGFALRTIDVGAGPLQGDEAWLTFLAYNFGHNGQRAELGVTSSATINQPPFFHDVFAIPFAFDPDPRIARLFMAILQMVGMAILYFMLQRYWTSRIALAGLMLYTVLPRAVWAGRFLWNPYLAIPFFIAFLTCGLLAADGKRWARWLQFPMLACIIGAHPILAMTGLLCPIFVLRDWVLSHTRRLIPQLMRDYAIGIVLAGLVLLPWGIGIVHQRINTPDQGVLILRARSPLTIIVQSTVEAATSLDLGAFLVSNNFALTLSDGLVVACTAIGWLILLSGVFLTGRAIAQMLTGQSVTRSYPDLVIGVAYLIPPIVLIFSPARTFDQYFITLVPCSAAILAILLMGGPPQTADLSIRSSMFNKNNRNTAKNETSLRGVLSRSYSVLRPARVALLILVGVIEAVYATEALIQIHDLSHFSRDSMPSLQDMIHLRNAAVRPGFETLYLVDSGSPRAFEQELVWQILANKGASRVIWGNDFALPVPQNGATYIGYADSTLIPEVYSLPVARIISNNLYRVVDVPPNSNFAASCRPTGVTRLANGVTILGYYVPRTSFPSPQQNQPWTIYVLWRTSRNQEHTSYQMFNHLVDAQGTKFAQRDLPTLITDLWRDNDLLVSKVTLTPNAQMPSQQPLYIRVGMYTLPTTTNPHLGNVNAIDDAGTPTGTWVTIPVCQPSNG